MARVLTESDTKREVIESRVIAVIGYGSQGHAHAQNLRDSGLRVIVGVRPGKSRRAATRDGFDVYDVGEAVRRASITMLLINDEFQPQVYVDHVLPGIHEGDALAFAHGFNIHFGQVVPPKTIDVFMVAPKGPGHLVRRIFTEGKGVPALIAVEQDFTGKARDLALAYACGIGAGRAGILETTFKEETETDLFGEQTVLCGGATALVKAGFETLVNAGYQPEIAYFECLHELKLIVDLMYESGISGMRYSISDTAQFGDMTRGPRVVNEETRAEMRRILKEIQEGAFAREWILENRANRPVFNALARKDEAHQIETVGSELRSMMHWMKKPTDEGAERTP